MPLPVIAIWITIAVVSALVGTTIAVVWDDIIIALQGKRVAVLGARGVGKTHLIKFLSTGTIPQEYKQTVAPEKASSRRFSLKDLDLKVKESLDVSGDTAAYAEWKQLVLGTEKSAKPTLPPADFVFYLLRADLLIAGDGKVEGRVRADLKHVGEWLRACNPRPRFFIVGTFCDMDSEFQLLTADKIGDYADKFNKLRIVNDLVALAGGRQQVKVVLGSMKTPKDTEALVYQIFMQVAS